MGLDVSTKTGCVVLREQFGHPEVLHSEQITAHPSYYGLERASAIAEKMLVALREHHPEVVVFEGYGFHGQSLATLVEIGTVLRYFVRQEGRPFWVAAPTLVKKFAAGKGNIPKSMIPMHVLKRWGWESATDDEADAYVLAAMGLAERDALGDLTKSQREALKKMEQGYLAN